MSMAVERIRAWAWLRLRARDAGVPHPTERLLAIKRWNPKQVYPAQH